MTPRRDARGGTARGGAGRSGAGRSGTGRSGTGRSGTGRDGADLSGTGRSRSGAGQGRPARGGDTGRVGRGEPPSSRGAGRTGRVGGREARPEPTLGGEQVEGRQAVRELLVAGNRKVREVWVSTDPDRNEVVGDIVDLARSMRVPVTEVARPRLDRQARSEAPQGVIAFAAPLQPVELADLMRRTPSAPPFLVAVDGVTDPGNLGALLRSCDGAGVTGVILPKHRAVHVTPTVAKASAGAIEHVRMALVGGLPAALSRLRDAGIWVVGLDDAAERNLSELGDLATGGICLVLGAEGPGLSRLVRERCDLLVRIPMRGRLSSLNVSTAAALATYEVARHRH